jgi:hypothetical protein
MKRWITPTALCLAGSFALVSAAGAQQPSSSQKPDSTTTTTQVTDDGMTQTTKITTVEGKVVRYEPGKTIVVLGPDSREVTYMLSPTVIVPADIQVGRVVTLSTEPSASGPVIVTRITTRTIASDGSMKTETQTRAQSSTGEQTTTKSTTQSGVTSITGTVSAYEPGRSVTFLLPDKTTVVYTVDTSSQLPPDLAVGKTYVVETTRTTSSGPLVVKRITTTTTTKKTVQ